RRIGSRGHRAGDRACRPAARGEPWGPLPDGFHPASRRRPPLRTDPRHRVGSGPGARRFASTPGGRVMTLAPLPGIMLDPLVRAALLEDLGRAGDLTTDAIVPNDLRATTVLS